MIAKLINGDIKGTQTVEYVAVKLVYRGIIRGVKRTVNRGPTMTPTIENETGVKRKTADTENEGQNEMIPRE